jgi:hypothetical protein
LCAYVPQFATGAERLRKLQLVQDGPLRQRPKARKTMMRVSLDRRRFLSSVAVAAASLAVPSTGGGAMSMKRIAPNQASDSFRADVDLELVAKPGSAPILPGRETNVWRYSAKLLDGPADTLTPVADSYLGPILRFTKGQ